MILLFIEILIIAILAMILSTLAVDERKSIARKMHIVRLKGYWDGTERRTVDRLNITLEVSYYLNAKPIAVESQDISTKGIRLLLDEKIEKGTPIRLEIKLPNQHRLVKANGEIIWAKESLEDEKISAKRLFHTGIKFSKLATDDKKRLFDFVHGL